MILVGEDERQHHYPADKLPEGAWEGTWLSVRVESGERVFVEVDQGETDATRRPLQEKMDKSRARDRRVT